MSVSALPFTEAKNNASSATIRFDQIDVLRGLAAIMVVLHHCCGPLMLSWWQVTIFGHVFYPSRIFYHGYIGVDLFLVLSGFCLAWPVLARPDKPFQIATYAQRRFHRIYPPYFITFVLLLLLGWVCRRSHLPSFAQIGFAEPLTPLQCLASLTLQMTHLCPVFWTLCLEARWYVLFPLVVLLARKISVWPILALAIVVSILTPFTTHGPLKLLIYLPAFVAGVLAAQLHAKAIRKTEKPSLSPAWLFGLGTALSFLLLLAELPPPGTLGRGTIQEVLPTTCFFFFLLMLALNHKAALPLPMRGLQKVGIFSYSLYLVHLPIIELGQAIYQPSHFTHAVQLFYWQCMFVPIIIAFSYLFFLIAEKPFIAGSPSGNVALKWWKKPLALFPRKEAVTSKEIV